MNLGVLLVKVQATFTGGPFTKHRQNLSPTLLVSVTLDARTFWSSRVSQVPRSEKSSYFTLVTSGFSHIIRDVPGFVSPVLTRT